MSHFHEREEKTCLNCGASPIGRYCYNCGQENIEPRESFWHLLGHFLSDLTHFDGKLFVTLKYLLFRPGFLTKEYIAGKRASYLNPIRMYLFISALYFLLLMSFFINSQHNIVQTTNPKKKTENSVKTTVHTTRQLLDSLAKDDTVYTAKTLREYDSLQNVLPVAKRDGPFQQTLTRKGFALQKQFTSNPKEFQHSFYEKFYHSLPYMLFISVPVIALLLQLLYIRRKQFFYVSHIIFTLHLYCLIFISFILRDTFNAIDGWARYLSILISIGYFVYLYIALLNFYKQGWFKTLVKFFILLMFGSIIIGLLTGVLAVFAAWKMT